MSKTQTRRSLSVRGDTYAALRAHCARVERSMSDVIEELLVGIVAAERLRPVEPRKPVPLRIPPPVATPKRPAAMTRHTLAIMDGSNVAGSGTPRSTTKITTRPVGHREPW